MAPFEIKWQAPEFEYREKSVSWYWISIIAAIVMIGIAVWQRNFLFGLFIIVAEILILAWANHEPPLRHFSINEKGLVLSDEKKYRYEDFENFSLDDSLSEDWPDLFFQFRRRLRPFLKIKIPKENSAEIQKVLSSVLPQVEHERSLLDSIEKIIGF